MSRRRYYTTASKKGNWSYHKRVRKVTKETKRDDAKKGKKDNTASQMLKDAVKSGAKAGANAGAKVSKKVGAPKGKTPSTSINLKDYLKNTPQKVKQVNLPAGKYADKTLAEKNNKRYEKKTSAGELSRMMNTNGKAISPREVLDKIPEEKSWFVDATKGSAKTFRASVLNTVATFHGNVSKGRIERENQNPYARQRGSNDRRWINKTSEEQEKIKESIKQTDAENQKRYKKIQGAADEASADLQNKASKIKASGVKDIEKAKEGLGKVGRFGVDLYTQMLQWGGDAVIGMATGTGILAPMFFRSFGDTSMTARESGASKGQQLFAGTMGGLVEAATEKIASPFLLFKKTAGKGWMDNLTERAAYNIANKLLKKGMSKDLAYKVVKNGVKSAIGMTEEGFEEVVSGLAQPVNERIYDTDALKQYGNIAYWKQLGKDFTMGATMSAILGGGGAVVSKGKGTTSQTEFTKGEKDQLIQAGKGQKKDTDAYKYADKLEKQQARGEKVLNEQAIDLAGKVYEEQHNAEKAKIKAAEKAEKEYVHNVQKTAGNTDTMKKDRRITSPIEQVMVDQVVAKKVTEKASDIESKMVESGVETERARKVSAPVARIVLGTGTQQDIQDATGHPESRAVIEAETGVKLPYTDKGVKDALDVYGAGVRAAGKDGIVNEARDGARELATQMLTTNLDEKAASIFRKGMEGIDFDALPEYVEGFNLYYEGGAVNYDYGNIPKTYDRYIPETVKMAIYNAGKRAGGYTDGEVQLPGAATKGEIPQEKQIDDAGALRYTLGNKGTSGAGNPKFSEMSADDVANIAQEYKSKSPIKIPGDAAYKAQSKAGYEQISYKWKDGTYKYESRWHTKTPGAPESQGNTWVINRTKPGSGGVKPSTEFLVGEEWVPGYKWYDAISARQAGTATKEQIKLLDKGHWKE